MEKQSRKRKKRGKKPVRYIGLALVLAALCAGTGAFLMAGRLSAHRGPDGEENLQAVSSVHEAERVTYPSETAQTEPEPTAQELLDEEVLARIGRMTLEEKVCQLFVVTPEALTGADSVTQAGNQTRKAMKERPVGGLIYFRGNLQSPDQTKALLKNTMDISLETEQFPILLSVDEEGSRVTRIAGQAAFGEQTVPDMAQIGAEGQPEKAYEVGSVIGEYLARYGFNLDFAPVADVLTNPENQVIGPRSFGSDPQLVWTMAQQVAQGFTDQGVIPVYKHFPGHGATLGDTHEGFAYTDKTLEQMEEAELVPFQQAIDSGADCIMTAHIAAPQVTGDQTPASLSYRLTTQILREKMGFQGVVITDALNMGAIQQLYSSGEAAVRAVEAGADLLLMPADFQEACQGVLDAVKEGRISEQRIDQSLLRIGRMKLKEKQQEGVYE